MDASDDEYDISTQEENKFVKEIVRIILALDHSKKPIKQSDIIKGTGKKLNRKQLSGVFETAKKRLNDMGMTLLETKSTSAKSFILISNNFPLPSMHQFASESEIADRTLLILVLTYIFMKEGTVSNVDLFKHLQDLNIYNENNPVHDYFGDVKKKILNEFVSQLYLEKKLDKEAEVFEIQWGERALAEVSKRSILEFVCKIGYEGTIQPNCLLSHYQAALEEEKGGDGNAQEDVMVVES